MSRRPRLNNGAIKLQAYLVRRYGAVTGAAITAFAKEVGCTLYAGRKWLSGERRPRPEHQIKIRRIAKISADDWIGA